MIKRLFSSQLRINVVSGAATTIINTAVLAVGYPVYLHFLGYEKYGVWLVLSTVLGLAQLGNLGIGHAVVKLVAEEYGRNDVEAVQEYITSAVVLLAGTGLVVLSLILLFRSHIIGLFKLSQENADTVHWMLPYVASLSVYAFIAQALNASLSGLGRMDLANYVQTAGRVTAVAVASCLLYVGRGIGSLLVGSLLSYVVVHLASLVLIYRIAPIQTLRVSSFSVQRARRLLHFGTGVLSGSLLSMLLSPFNKLMLARYAGVASIPVYEVAYNGSMQVRALSEAGIRAVMPEASRIGLHMTERVRARIREINRRAVSLILHFGLPSYAVLIVGASPLLRAWFGSKVAEDLPLAFRLGLLNSLLSLACVPAYYLLLGLGRVRHCVIGQAFLFGGNVLLVLIFARTGGDLLLSEVLIAMIVATGVSSVYVVVQNRRMLGRAAQVSGWQGPSEEVSSYQCRVPVHV